MKLHHPESLMLKYGEALQRVEKLYRGPTYMNTGLMAEVMNLTPLSVYFIPPVRDILKDSDNPASFLLLKEDGRLSYLLAEIMDTFKSFGSIPESILAEELMTAVKYTHSYLVWSMNGSRLYEVHPDLAWALQRTELQDFPTEDLQLPCNALYLELPPTLYIPNRITGDHPAAGAFIMEELLDDIRTWRIVLTGGPNESSGSKDYVKKYGSDDALFHYWIDLSQKTVQECIATQLETTRTGSERTCHWKGKSYHAISPKYIDDGPAFEDLRKTLTSTFQYIMNCVIYSTTAESDVWFYEASKEYRDLKDRAMKAKGDKRKRLFAELKNVSSHTRYVMGSRTVIDRKRTKEASVEGEGRKLTKGGLVAGHWQRYWVGVGKKQCVRKLRLPFWRGPGEEFVPAEEGRHVTRLK